LRYTLLPNITNQLNRLANFNDT
jgi:ubiquitin-conjugating enzyme E2 W